MISEELPLTFCFKIIFIFYILMLKCHNNSHSLIRQLISHIFPILPVTSVRANLVKVSFRDGLVLVRRSSQTMKLRYGL
jgi:hypothetical protein